MKIYISSTTEDLAEYRITVINALQRSGHTPVCMEHHAAGDRAPKDECLKEVSKCKAYVGIFAWRYGFIPPQSETSITELEYREAVKCGIHTLIFLLDEKVDWPEKYREKGLNGERITKLRSELKLSKWIREFHGADNLATEVLAAVMHVAFWDATQPNEADEEVQNEEFRKLREDQREAENKRKQKKRNPLPVPIPERLIRYFQDRNTELLKLKQYLSNSNIRMVLICGRGGMGKSTLIVKLIQELREKFDVNGPNPIDAVDCIIFIQLSEKGNRTPDRIIELLSRTLEPEAATELDEVWNQKNASIQERVAELFRGPLVHRRCLIILDNLESVLDEENHILSEYEGLSKFLDAFLDYDHVSTIIATSRRTLSLSHEGEIAAIGRRVQIPLDEGLPENYAVALLRELDKDGKRGLKDAPDSILRDLVWRCQAIPRTLETLVSTLQNSPTRSLESWLENEENLSELIENPAKKLFNSLQSEQHKFVVQALSIYDKPVPVVAVRIILPALPVDKILDELFRNFVINYDQGQFFLHPLDREFAYSQIPDNQSGFSKTELHKGAARFYKRLRKPADLWKNVEDLEPQLQEFRHLVKAMLFDDACQILNEIDREYLSTWGYHQQIIELRLQLVDKIKGSNLSGWNLCHLGSAYNDSGDSNNAKFHYEKALVIARENNDQLLVCRVLGNLALAEGHLGNRKKKEILLEEALKVAENIDDRLHKGRWLGNLTDIKLELGHINIREAISNYEIAILIAKELCDFRFAMIWSEILGDYYTNTRDFENSKGKLLAALSMSRKINARWQTCRMLIKLGNLFRNLGDKSQELYCYEEVHEVVREMSNYYQQFNVLIWLATKYAELALFNQQQNCYEEIEIVLGNVDDKLTKHGLLLYLGDQLSEINKEKALESYLQAMEVAEGISDQTYLFSTSLKLANLYDRMKKTDKAIACYKSALLNSRRINSRTSEAIVLNEYANLLLNSGEAAEAIEHYELALPLVEELNDISGQLSILNRMGMASFYLQKMQQAIKYYERGLVIARKIQSRENEIVALFNIGDAYHQQGKYREAETYYKESLALDSATTKYKCLIGLGIICYLSNNERDGQSYFEEAIKILSPYRDYPNLFHPHLAALGLSLLAIGKGEEAIELYSDCIRNSPPKEHIYYAIQDLIMLKQVPKRIEGLAEILNLLKKAFDKIPLQEKLSD